MREPVRHDRDAPQLEHDAQPGPLLIIESRHDPARAAITTMLRGGCGLLASWPPNPFVEAGTGGSLGDA